MKKTHIFALIFMFMPVAICAQTAQDNRRLEEEKRQILRSTEKGGGGYSLPGEAPGDSLAQLDYDYFQSLFNKKKVDFADGCRVLAILLDVPEKNTGFSQQYDFLKGAGILMEKKGARVDPQRALRRGEFALMLCKALGMKGGLFPRLFGYTERLAVKELVFQGIMSEGSVRGSMSGEELIMIVTNAAEYASGL